MSLICIDAGHGGHDPGAVNHNVGVTEKSLTLKIAALLGEALASVGHDVFFTRELDVFVPWARGAKSRMKRGLTFLFQSISMRRQMGRPAVLKPGTVQARLEVPLWRLRFIPACAARMPRLTAV